MLAHAQQRRVASVARGVRFTRCQRRQQGLAARASERFDEQLDQRRIGQAAGRQQAAGAHGGEGVRQRCAANTAVGLKQQAHHITAVCFLYIASHPQVAVALQVIAGAHKVQCGVPIRCQRGQQRREAGAAVGGDHQPQNGGSGGLAQRRVVVERERGCQRRHVGLRIGRARLRCFSHCGAQAVSGEIPCRRRGRRGAQQRAGGATAAALGGCAWRRR